MCEDLSLKKKIIEKPNLPNEPLNSENKLWNNTKKKTTKKYIFFKLSFALFEGRNKGVGHFKNLER